jgi:hypothetical protein
LPIKMNYKNEPTTACCLRPSSPLDTDQKFLTDEILAHWARNLPPRHKGAKFFCFDFVSRCLGGEKRGSYLVPAWPG